MPHSSGGSHGGSSSGHSGGGHSGGGHSGGGHPSSYHSIHSSSSSHSSMSRNDYGYYNEGPRGHDYYFYPYHWYNREVESEYISYYDAIKNNILTCTILAVVLTIITGIMLVFSIQIVSKVDTNYDTTIIIQDDANVIEDQEALYDAMVLFQKETGITPAFVSTRGLENIEDIESLAYKQYVSMFDDEKHWLFYYSSGPAIGWIGMQGNDTDTILDENYTLNRFNSYVNDHTFNITKDYLNIGKSLTNAFYYSTKYIMCNRIVSSYFLIPLSIDLGVLLYLNLAKKELIIEEADAKERQEEIMNHFKSTYYRKVWCPKCHAQFTLGSGDRCPICGRYYFDKETS